MHYFFFDAAGDNGFQIGKASSSRGGGSKPFYVLAVISTPSQFDIEDRIRKLKTLWGINENQEFKFHTIDQKKKAPFFQNFADQNFTGYVAVWDKMTSSQTPTLEKLKDGNKVTSKLLAPIIAQAVTPTNGPIIDDFYLYIDERKNNNVVKNMIRKEISDELKKLKILYQMKLSPRDSKVIQSIQLADMVAGMVMDSFETANDNLLRIIRHKLIITKI